MTVTTAPAPAAADDSMAKKSPTSAAGPRKIRRSPAWRIGVTAALAVAMIYFLFPVYWLAIAATKSTSDLFGSSGLVLNNPQLWSNLVKVATYDGGIFGRWVLNSVLYSGVGAVVATVCSLAAGYCLAKFNFRGREMVFNIRGIHLSGLEWMNGA